jgi:hypothetical protein
MIKLLFALSLVTISFTSLAGTLPVKPIDCYKDSNFCSTISVKRINGTKVLDLEVFALIDRNKFPDIDSVIGRFVDFYQWPQYVAGSDNIDFTLSETVESRDSEYSHRFDYTIKAPWPVRKSRVFGIADFSKVTENFPGSLLSYSFTIDKTVNYGGVSEYFGNVHIYNKTAEYFEVSYKSIVSPTIKIGLDLAKPYVCKPIEEILQGMYQ